LSGGTGSGTNYTACTTNTAGIAKTANVANINLGATFTFTLGLVNNYTTSQTFTITDTLPAGFTYVSSVASQGTVNTASLPTLTWNAGTIASGGATASLTITVRGTTVGTHTNVATLTSPCLVAGSCPTDSATVNVVAPSIDHYAISYPNGTPGITCEALAVQITAHDSAHVATAPTASTTITLTTNPATDGWSLRSGGGTFTAPDQYRFNGTETSAQFWLTRTTPTTAPHIDINVTDGAATESLTEDPRAEFANAIFRFFGTGSPENIGTQIAGKNSAVAPGDQTLQLRAVRTSTTTSACVPAIQGTTSVNLAYECNNPASCTGSNLLSMATGVDTQTI
ncbi:MAG TPA: DUF11 domain-containing protein, partial [Gammaproteobacteria bacterium]|nr:DUF11 domain-containing protein [Gammaproteobacteria bacterium]